MTKSYAKRETFKSMRQKYDSFSSDKEFRLSFFLRFFLFIFFLLLAFPLFVLAFSIFFENDIKIQKETFHIITLTLHRS